MFGGKRVDLTRAEVRKTILQFVDGDDELGEWGWDDFVSVPIKDPLLDAVRAVCSSTHEAYPESSRWCSTEGIELMRAIANAL